MNVTRYVFASSTNGTHRLDSGSSDLLAIDFSSGMAERTRSTILCAVVPVLLGMLVIWPRSMMQSAIHKANIMMRACLDSLLKHSASASS